MGATQVHGDTGTWLPNADGNWTAPANWQGGVVPNAAGDIAVFRNDITATRTITLDAAVTLGGLQLGDRLAGSAFTFSGTNALTFDNNGANAFVSKYGSATDTWRPPLVLTDSVNFNIYAGILDVTGASNVQVSYTGAGDTIKGGAGTLRLNIDAISGAGYTGDWVVNLGTLNLGGANSAAPTALGTGTGGIILNGTGRSDLAVFSLNNNGTGNNGTITYAGNNDVILQGAARINVDRNYISGANTGNTIVLDNLTMNGGILETTGGNSYGLRFDGTTTLVGQTNVLSPNTAQLTLAGPITDGANARALIKEGGGRLVILNSANSYDGVTVVKDGILQISAGANLGTGKVFVNGGALSLAAASQLTDGTTMPGGLQLVGQLGTSRFAIPSVAISSTVGVIDSSNPLMVNVPISGMTVSIDSTPGVVTSNIDLSSIGSGSTRVWLSNLIGADRTYRGTIFAAPDNVIRLSSATNTFILDTTTDMLGGASASAALVFGLDHANAINITTQAITQGTGGTVSVRVNNSATLGNVTVNRGVTANINGSVTTPLGAGIVTGLGGTLSTDNTSTAQFGNTDFRLYGGSTLLLDNSNVTTANVDRRLLPTTDIDLSTSTLRIIGDGATLNASSSQTVNSIDYQGGSTISIDSDAVTQATRLTTLTTGTLNRVGQGTLILRNTANLAATFGTSAGTQKLLVTTAPTVTNDMIGAHIALWGGTTANDQALPMFATYDATHGVQAATFDVTATTAAALAGATSGQIVDINGQTANMTVTTGNVQALRIRTTANSNQSINTGTITIGAAAGAGQGAGLYLVHTANNEVIHSANFAFGAQEGVIYAATSGGTSGVVRLNGNLTGTAGITRFGNGILRLGGTNSFTGPFTLNSGDTRIASANGAGLLTGPTNEINLWGGVLSFGVSSTRFNNNVTIFDDARLGNDNVGGSGFNNLTIAARSGSSAPVVAWIQAVSGSNLTPAYGGLTLNGAAQFNVVHGLQINGAISGPGNLDKFGNERLYIGGDSSAYGGSVTAYAGALVSLNAASTAKPFGVGTLTMNPGSSLRLAAPTNLNAGQLTMRSDLGGISGLAMSFVGDPATVFPAFAVESSAPWKGYLGIDAIAFSQNIDQSSAGLWGGNVHLGASLGATGVFTGTLTPNDNQQFLFGGGQGTVRIANPLTGAGNSVVIGLSMTGDVGRANQIVNNSLAIAQYDVPMSYGGGTTVNVNAFLRLSARNAVTGIGDITLNGGTLQPDSTMGQLRMTAPLTIANNIVLTADSTIQMQNNASDFHVNGTLQLAPGSTGVVRSLNVGVDQPGGAQNNAGLLYLDGGISDGPGGSGNHFIKTGLGVLMLTGPQTYTGTTNIAGGFLGINGDADLASSSHIILSGGGLGIYENSFTTTRNISFFGGNGWLDVAGGLTLTQDAASTFDGTSFLIKRGLGTVVLNGSNAQTGLLVADGVLQINHQESFGNPAETGADRIQFGGDFTAGSGQNTNTRYTGGTLRVNGTMTTNRGMQFNNNGNTAFSGGVDVTGANIFTVTGIIQQGTELDYAFKTGTGTLLTTGANTWRQFVMTNGTLQFANSQPWVNNGASGSNTTLEFLGGTINAANTAADINLANGAGTSTYNYGGGMHLRMESGAGFEVTIDADNLIRVNQGTLVIETGASTTLGGAVNTNAGRFLAANVINSGVTRAAAINNGIFAGHLIGADSAGAGFFLQDDATNGFKQYAGATTATLAGLNATGIGEITSDPGLTGSDNSIYGFRTTADISGGTLRVTAIDNLKSGAILINGSNTISTHLIFDPTSATTPGAGTPGEGLVYVKTGESATISGNVTANAFTKFGDGTLTLSGNNLISGDVNVQDGVLRLGGGSPFSRLNSELNINGGATLDLNATSIAVETLGSNNRQVATANIGGQVTNTAATQATLMVASPITSTYNGTLDLNMRLVKAGQGVLVLNGFSSATPDAGNNTYTGGTEIYGVNTTGGIDLNNTTFGLGGYNGSAAGDVNLYSGTLGLLFSNGTTGVNGTNGQQFNNMVVKIGAEAGDGITVNVKGPGQINVNLATPSSNTAFGQGNVMQIGALNMSNSILNLSGGNLYRLRVAGTTTIQGAQATFQTNSDGPSGALELAGLVTGAGALNKTGDGTMRGIIISGIANNYSGGTNIIGGDVQVTGTSGTPLGTGPVRVFPDGTLRIAGNGSVNGAKLEVMSRVNALGAVVLDDNFSPSVLNGTNFSSVYNSTLQLGQPYFNQPLNLAAIGDGRAFLGSGISQEAKYMAATLGAGVPDAWNPGVGVYRVAGGANNLAFDGVNNVLTGNSYLQVGPQRNMVLGAIGNSGNGVLIRNSNNYTGGTQITEGTILYTETGGSPVGETPFGTGAIEVYGQLRLQGSLGSMWKADAGAATNNVILRPGGLVYLIDGNSYGTGGNLVAGNQGRWGDAVGIDLNGGTFRFDGATNWNSEETIGVVDVRKNGGLQVFRNSTASSAQLNVGGLNRIAGGTLSISHNAGFLGLNTTTPLSYERLTVSGGVALGGITANGAGVVNGGIAPVWIVDATTASYLGYDPTGAGSGFQPLRTDATAPLAGELSFSTVGSALPVGTGTQTVNLTGAATLGAGATSDIWALRVTNNISNTGAGGGAITMRSGGLLLTGGTINPALNGVIEPMTLNFGVGGAGEAIVYNSATAIIQAQMNAALGLTKFGSGQLQIHSINPGIGGPITVNAGNLYARVPFSGSGTPVGGVFNGQDVILNGGALVLDPFMADADGISTEIASTVRATALFDSNIFIRGDATIGNNSTGNYVRIQDLTFENAGGAAAMDGNGVIALALQSGLWVRGTTTLIPQARINSTFNGFSQSTLAGLVTGSGPLEKFGSGALTLLNGGNNYSGGTVINGTTGATAVSTVASALRGAGTPFSTGPVTVNPGGLLRIADNANIASNPVTVKSDGYALGGIGIAHNGPLPTIITSGAPTAGQVKVESTGPYDGVLALDYGFYSQDLNPATIGNGNWWIGNSQQAEAYYFNDTLGASANGKYLLGGGGNQSGVTYGAVQVSGSRTSLFENIFAGGTAGDVRVEVGAQTADFTANAPSFVNGNAGFQALISRNDNLVGDVRVNVNSTLGIGNNFALGSGRLVLNGGNVRADFGPNNFITSQITIDNDVLLQGDWSTSNGNEFVINGNVAMHDGTAGATRIWNLTGTSTMAVRGVISGNDGSNLIKRGAQVVSFSGTNTYQGYTQIDRGEIVAAGNVLPGVNGPLGNSHSPIILGVEGTNLAGSLGIGGKWTVGRDILVTGAPGTGINLIEGRTNERAIVSGGISITTGAVLTLGAPGLDHADNRGGVLEIQGPISGAGALTVGTTAAVTSFGGTVLLSGNVNGYGTSTYSGGTTLQTGRLQIGSDTYYSGAANNPTIISGPLGTGAITFASGEASRGGIVEAVGGSRTIVNPLANITATANSTLTLSGRHGITFTRDLNVNADTTLRTRTFAVPNLQQPATFSGNLSASGTAGVNIVKTGAGLLVLTGTNTFATSATTGIQITQGILRVNADAALGAGTSVRLNGGTLSLSESFTSARQLILQAASGVDVAEAKTVTLTAATTGAFGVTKTGPGTLALNNAANTITALTLGGVAQGNSTAGLFSHTGGAVSTTAVSGTPFATSTLTLNSGTLSLIGGGVAQALSIPTINYGAAAAIALNQGATSSRLTASTAFVRQGVLNSVAFGTLTIQPSALANLGVTESLIVTAGAPANTALTGGNILSVPSVFIALAGSGQDADFARYDAVSGFAAHNVTTVATLAATAPGNVGDVTAADVVGTAPGDVIDIGALRLAAAITSFDGTQLLRINNGGLIFNGAAGAALNVDTLFGTGTGAGLKEAIVYVRDGQAVASTIAGDVTARDFTKTGPGALELSGTGNLLNTSNSRLPILSVQNGTFRFASAAAQFTNENRPAAVSDITGHYVLNVNESGVFDLKGLNIAVGGLAGNGTVSSSVSGGATLTVKNGFGADTTFSGGIADGAGAVGMTKRGNGVLTLSGNSSYSAGTTIEAGRVLNATGIPSVLGTVDARHITALGGGAVSLAGGTLSINVNLVPTEVDAGISFNTFGPGNGYDFVISNNGFTNGIPLPANISSTININSANVAPATGVSNTGINSLTVNAPLLTIGGAATAANRALLYVKGATTFSQPDTVLRTITKAQLILGGKINAAGKTITKIGFNGDAGTAELIVTNTESGAGQNEVGLWKVYGGILSARAADGAANPLGLAPTVELNGGSTNYGLQLLTDGDGTLAAQRITTYANTNIRFGSMLPVSSDEFVMSSSSRIQADRVVGNNDDKTVVFNNLEMGGVLGSPYLYTTGANGANFWVNGTTTFIRDFYIQNDLRITLNGLISGNGTFVKRFGSDLFINADNTSGWAGGTMLGGGGTVYLGSLEGNQVTLSNTAKLGTGHVFINPASALQINDAGNLQSGQNLYVGGNLDALGVLRLAADLSLDQVRLRASGVGGAQPGTTDYYLTATNPSSGVLAINTIYTHALDQNALGDGMWYLGGTTNGIGASGSYDAPTLGAGRGDTYRLGAGGSNLFFGSNGNANILTDVDASTSTSLVVGAPMSIQNNGTLTNGSGGVVLLTSQNYGGSTFVNRNSTLDFRGTLTTSGIETYGILNVAGESGTFLAGGTGANIPVTLRPGSTLRFDNTAAGVLPVTATQGRWEDSVGITLNDSIFRLQGNPAVEVVETVGAITANPGGNQIQVVRGVIGRGTELRTPSIDRVGSGTVQIVSNTDQIGSDERIIITGTAPTVTNGMVAPWMISFNDIQFLTYNADTGFTKAGFDRNQAAATLTTSVVAPTSRTLFSGNVVLNAGVDFSAYALRLDGNVTLGTATDNTAQIILGSGGLIANSTRTITTGIVAGSVASPSELILYNNGTVTIGDAAAANRNFQGQFLASSITKFGAGQLNLLSEQQTFTGDIHVQGGSLVLRYANGTETNPVSKAGGNGGTIFLEGTNTTLFLRGGQDNLTGDVAFNNSVTIGDYVPIVQIDVDRFGGSITGRANILSGNFTFGQNNSETGQILRFRAVNDMLLQIGDSASDLLTLNGRSVFDTDNNFNSNDGRIFVSATTTGPGTLVKGPIDTRADALQLQNVTTLNDWTGGTIVLGGTLRVFAKAPNVAALASTNITAGGISNGAITMMGGVLDLRVDSDGGAAADTNAERVFYGTAGNVPDLIVNGSSQINVDRTGLVAAGTTKVVALNNLTIGSQILTVTGGNSYSLEIAGTTTMQGNFFLNNSTDLNLKGAISDGGAGVLINKTNTGTLWIGSTNNDLSGPVYINAGLLAFGDRLTGSNTATLGIGNIYINPGAQIQVRSLANINTAFGQKVVLTGTPYAAAEFRAVTGFTQADYQNMIQSTTSTSNQTTILAFEGGTLNQDLDQSTIADGRIFFGNVGDRTITGASPNGSLTPGLANLPDSVIGGPSTNRVYRLGGGSGNTLILNLAGTGNLTDVEGPTDVQIGSLASLGPNGNLFTGFVYFQDQNTYTGQTVVSRSMNLRFNVGMNATNTAGPLGSNPNALIDVYGNLRTESGSSLRTNDGSAQFYTNIKLHPGSLLLFQDAQANGNRWDDNTPVNLDGSAIQVEGTNNLNLSSETIGALNFDRGARVYLNSEGTSDAILTAASVSRAAAGPGAGTGHGTLVFTPGAASRLGISNTSNNAELAIFTAAPDASATAAVAGMLPGYFIDGQAHRFVTHGANGITPVADGSMVGFSAGMTGGTAVVNLTTATTLPDFNPEIFALRGGNFALNSPTGANNDATITFGGSGADIGSVISTATVFTINPNLKFGATGTNEALFYAGGNIRVNGDITAGTITKFGTGTLEIGNDQSDAARGIGKGYSNGWVVNEGSLNLLTFGSAGNAATSNTIVLSGNRASTTSTLFLRAQPADTILNYTYSSGRIIAVDNATIDWDPGADDRVHTIADIEIQQSGGIGNTTADGTNDAQLRIVNNRNRSILAAGQLIVTNNAILNVDATSSPTSFYAYANNSAYLTTGTSAGMSVASLSGSARLTKWGDGYLYIRGNSAATFSGSFVLDQGSVYVSHNGSLGTGPVTVNRYGALDIGVANYVPTNASITYNEGSIERWSVNGARTGTIDLGLATLQVAADQTGTVAVTLNGGGIEGWLRSDDLTETERHVGVFRNLGPNVSVTLAGDSFVGTQYYLGANGLNNGQQINDYRPAEEFSGSGVVLDIKGVISESGASRKLTKVGYDTVILSGHNTYTGGTVVSAGKLMLGTTNALAPTGNLTTNANGVLDLNGNDQTVAMLNNSFTPTTPGVASGFVTNSGPTPRKLTVGNGIDSAFDYSGVIQHNVALTKIGSGHMVLNAANTYLGNTTIGAGSLALGLNGGINDSPWLNIAGGGSIFDVSAKASYTFDGKISGGGTDAAGTTYLSVVNAARINGNLIVGDHVGAVSRIGTLAPGGNSVADDITTAGNLVGHLYIKGDLTLNGALTGTTDTDVTRLTLQLSGATSNMMALGFTFGSHADFIDGLAGGTAAQQDILNGDQGNLAAHDYLNIDGNLTINENGRIAVSNIGGYSPGFGDIFNLLDWTTLANNSFGTGARYQDGTENNDLDLPTLSPGLIWDTSLFASHGVLVVVPEPTRMLLLFIGLLAVFGRRRRSSM